MAQTPVHQLPYPAATDTADIPRDIQALATTLDPIISPKFPAARATSTVATAVAASGSGWVQFSAMPFGQGGFAIGSASGASGLTIPVAGLYVAIARILMNGTSAAGWLEIGVGNISDMAGQGGVAQLSNVGQVTRTLIAGSNDTVTAIGLIQSQPGNIIGVLLMNYGGGTMNTTADRQRTSLDVVKISELG